MGGSKGQAVIHKRKRQGKELVFDDSNRREWLSGFRKRKLGRQKQGAENEKLMAVAKRRFERLQRKRAEESILRDLAKEEQSFHAKQAEDQESEDDEDEGDDEGDSSDEEDDLQTGPKTKEVKYETKTQIVTVITKPIESEPEEESEEEAPKQEEVVSASAATEDWLKPREAKNNSTLDEPRIKKFMKTLEAKSHSKYGIEGKKQRKIQKKRRFKASDKKPKLGPKDKKAKGGKGGKGGRGGKR